MWFTQSLNEIRTKFFWYYCTLGKVFFKYKFLWRVTCELHGIWKVMLWHKVEEYGLKGNVQSMMQHKKLRSSWFAFNWNFSFIFGDLMCFGVHIYVWNVIVRHLLKLLIKVKCKICRAKVLGCGIFSKIRGLGRGDSQVQRCTLGMSLTHGLYLL